MKLVVPDLVSRNHEITIYTPDFFSDNTPVILAVHGMWATAERFSNYGKYFSERGFVFVAPTLARHYKGNETDKELGKTSIRSFAANVAMLLRGIRDGSAIRNFHPHTVGLIGHSMGGLVAALVAQEESVDFLIRICSAPESGIPLRPDNDYRKRISKYAKNIFCGKPYLPDFESLSLYVYSGMPKDQHTLLYSKAVYESGTAAREILAGSANPPIRWVARLFSKPVEVDEQLINCPVLIIGGGRDKIVPSEVAINIYEKFNRRNYPTVIKIFDNLAHWPQFEPGWEETAEYILGWINSLDKKDPQ